jgi:Nitrile hydratase, alpha chain
MSISKVIGRAWADPAYKAKLLQDPHAVLAEAGVKVPAGSKVRVVEDTAAIKHFILPAAPRDASGLSEQELEKIAGGAHTVACV